MKKRKKLLYERLGLPEKKTEKIEPVAQETNSYEVETIEFRYDSKGKLISRKTKNNHLTK